MKHFLLIAMTTLMAQWSLAATSKPAPVTYGKAIIDGKDCAKNGFSFTPSPDGTSFTILSDNSTLESKKAHEFQMCRILVPVTVPAGYRLEIENLDLRGFMSLPQNSIGGFGAYPRFVSRKLQYGQGDWAVKWSYGEFQDEVVSSTRFRSPIKSFCGGVQWLEIYTFIGEYGSPQQDARLITLDSIDAGGGLVAAVSKRACK